MCVRFRLVYFSSECFFACHPLTGFFFRGHLIVKVNLGIIIIDEPGTQREREQSIRSLQGRGKLVDRFSQVFIFP